MIADGDILIGVFSTRLGTPTENHASGDPAGTVEEIEEFLANGRPASLFFSSMPAVLGNVDADQWQALNEFLDAMGRRGLIRTFESHPDLSDAVLMSLNHHV